MKTSRERFRSRVVTTRDAMPSVETYLANYEDPVHAKAVVDLLDGYAVGF